MAKNRQMVGDDENFDDENFNDENFGDKKIQRQENIGEEMSMTFNLME